jgi:hypothetical protein
MNQACSAVNLNAASLPPAPWIKTATVSPTATATSTAAVKNNAKVVTGWLFVFMQLME